MKNLYKLYYKDYFQAIDFSVPNPETDTDNKASIQAVNQEILNTQLVAPPPLLKRAANVNWEYRVLYPGLITGVGINHEANIEGEFKLGIHLDYLTGMPIIYGSTVKGILCSAFHDAGYICSLCEKILGKKIIEDDVEAMRRDIFEGDELMPGCDPWKDESYKAKSIYKRDVFFDAVITKADFKGRVLCPDSITPHYRNVLRDPVPLPFVKIAPGCVLEFRFRLMNSTILSREDKFNLFLSILQDSGIGAKSNVGYGNLDSVEPI
ncbi:MAG TPA: type III-B CRISPR module RAMP protein Cmr6 [Candidatus Phocaeicola merdavium]|nr:type III-B CRISPR module RAMP protein Cmr6 [Candidatus Phocaeicola merdavium]